MNNNSAGSNEQGGRGGGGGDSGDGRLGGNDTTTYIAEPGPSDVLSHRGAPIRRHPGNVHFQMLVSTRATEYHNSKLKEQKDKIINGIATTVSNNNGRFLHRIEPGTTAWVLMDQNAVMVKIRDALKRNRDDPNGTFIAEIRPYDVLSFRSIEWNQFTGNVRFQELVSAWASHYNATEHQSLKDEIVKRIAANVLNSNGRFLLQRDRIMQWVLMDRLEMNIMINSALVHYGESIAAAAQGVSVSSVVCGQPKEKRPRDSDSSHSASWNEDGLSSPKRRAIDPTPTRSHDHVEDAMATQPIARLAMGETAAGATEQGADDFELEGASTLRDDGMQAILKASDADGPPTNLLSFGRGDPARASTLCSSQDQGVNGAEQLHGRVEGSCATKAAFNALLDVDGKTATGSSLGLGAASQCGGQEQSSKAKADASHSTLPGKVSPQCTQAHDKAAATDTADRMENPSSASEALVGGRDDTNANFIAYIRPNDVLSTLGPAFYEHSGNVRFRELVLQSAQHYNTAEPSLKGEIVKNIAAAVFNSSGRFLRRTEPTKTWVLMDGREMTIMILGALLHYGKNTAAAAQGGSVSSVVNGQPNEKRPRDSSLSASSNEDDLPPPQCRMIGPSPTGAHDRVDNTMATQPIAGLTMGETAAGVAEQGADDFEMEGASQAIPKASDADGPPTNLLSFGRGDSARAPTLSSERDQGVNGAEQLHGRVEGPSATKAAFNALLDVDGKAATASSLGLGDVSTASQCGGQEQSSKAKADASHSTLPGKVSPQCTQAHDKAAAADTADRMENSSSASEHSAPSALAAAVDHALPSKSEASLEKVQPNQAPDGLAGKATADVADTPDQETEDSEWEAEGLALCRSKLLSIRECNQRLLTQHYKLDHEMKSLLADPTMAAELSGQEAAFRKGRPKLLVRPPCPSKETKEADDDETLWCKWYTQLDGQNKQLPTVIKRQQGKVEGLRQFKQELDQTKKKSVQLQQQLQELQKESEQLLAATYDEENEWVEKRQAALASLFSE